jgi:hypothetical protein
MIQIRTASLDPCEVDLITTWTEITTPYKQNNLGDLLVVNWPLTCLIELARPPICHPISLSRACVDSLPFRTIDH